MNEKSTFNYVKTVYISDLFYDVLDKIWIVLLAFILGLLCVMIPSGIEARKVRNELPAYAHSLDIQVFSEFDNNSLLGSAGVALDEDILNKLIEYEGLNLDATELRNAITYRMEGKYVVRYTVFTTDEDLAIKIMDGLANILSPELAENTEAERWLYNYPNGAPQEIKVLDYVNDGSSELIDVRDKKTQLWETYYPEKTGLLHMLKNGLILGIAAALVVILIIITKRLLSRKILSVADVESISNVNVLAVTDNRNRGTRNALDRIRQVSAEDRQTALIPIKNIIGIDGIVKDNSLAVDSGILFFSDSLESSSNAIDFCKNNDANAIFIIEDDKIKDIELKNSINLFKDMGIGVLGIIIVGVKGKKIKRRSEYFGKFYVE